MASHVRFGSDSEDERKEVTNHGQIHSERDLPAVKSIHRERQKTLSSARKKKSKSSLPANHIRSIERYLRHKEHELPPGVLKKKKQELDEWKRIRAERERRARERKFETRYKRIKFFERRKVQRILDNISKKGDRPEDREAKLQAQRDLQYIQKYPKDIKYIALFPPRGHTDETRSSVEQMRAIIEGLVKTPQEQNTENTEKTFADDFFLDNDNESD